MTIEPTASSWASVRILIIAFLASCSLTSNLGTTGSTSVPVAPTEHGLWWAHASDEYANGIGSDENGEKWDTVFTHQDVEKACGHRIKVNWDWASFQGHAFSGMTKEAPGHMCVGEVLFRIGVMCAPDHELSGSARPITTVTCRFKDCTELPPSAWTRDDGILDPGFEYALTNNGTNLDVAYCEKSSTTGTFDLYAWMKNPHYPVVKKPGSVQRRE